MTDSKRPINQVVEQSIELASQIIADTHNICILTGAGISAESGIPTFRDKQTGLWENYRAEELANIDAFRRDPQFVWSWYQWRRGLVKDKLPNPAHHAIADLQSHFNTNDKTFNLITQNVDDLHEQAGATTTHLHGHLWQNRCANCDTLYTKPIDYSNDQLLTCDNCSGFIRPDIVWFGEILPQNAWQFAENAAMTCDVFITIGTSSIVYPAAGLSTMAKQNGANIIEINLNPTSNSVNSGNSVVDITIAEKAGVALPKILETITDY